MRHLLRLTAVLALLFVASPAHAQISFGIQIGPPPAPRVYRVPRMPGPGYVWVEGYWYPEGRSYRWHDGYWSRPPFDGAYWVEPYYDGRVYVGGYWEDGRRRLEHDHRWDRERRRDERRDERR